MSLQNVIERQVEIAQGNTDTIALPKFSKYAICNLRGGVGKTTLSFNMSYLTDDILVVDSCPQGNLSYFFDSQYYSNQSPTVRDMILPHLISGLGNAERIANYIGATNEFFAEKHSFYIRSSSDLYLLPSQLITAINQALGLPVPQKDQVLENIVFSLKTEIEREMRENNLTRCLIDTSPFFAGATQLAWYAIDAMIVPVRTDQQSINSLELLIKTLQDSHSEFRKYLPNGGVTPKIQMVVLTHCGWSRQEGNRNIPNQQTKLYAQKVYDLLSQKRSLLSTDNPDNHLLLLDDFLGSGRISSALSKPIELLVSGESKTIDRVRVEVNHSVEKCKNQLRSIANLLW